MLLILLRLCTLRAKPQDLPYAWWLFGISAGLQVAVNALGLLEVLSPSSAVVAAAAYTLMLIALVHATLLARGFGARAVQALTAVNFVDALIGFAGWSVDGLLGASVPEFARQLPFVLWFVAAFGHILRHALELRPIAAYPLALVYFVLAAGITGGMIGVPPPPAS